MNLSSTGNNQLESEAGGFIRGGWIMMMPSCHLVCCVLLPLLAGCLGAAPPPPQRQLPPPRNPSLADGPWPACHGDSFATDTTTALTRGAHRSVSSNWSPAVHHEHERIRGAAKVRRETAPYSGAALDGRPRRPAHLEDPGQPHGAGSLLFIANPADVLLDELAAKGRLLSNERAVPHRVDATVIKGSFGPRRVDARWAARDRHGSSTR